MVAELNVKRRSMFYQKAWFMWIWLILLPPLGILFLWRQNRFAKKGRSIVTAVATVYFFVPIIIAYTTTIPLYYSQEEFVEAFNDEKEELNLPYKLDDIRKGKNVITSKLDEDITLIEKVEDDKIRELIMVGQGEGKDIVLNMGLLIGMTNPDLNAKEVGNVLEDLRLFDKTYKFQKNETEVELNTIHYNLKYEQSKGVIFSISKIN